MSGGVLPYSYIWSTGSTSSSITQLAQGEYCVTVSDKNGCRGIKCFTVGLNLEGRSGCNITCNGVVVKPVNSYTEYNPSDCTFARQRCGDGYYPNGLEWVDVGIGSFEAGDCRVELYCHNGELYSSHAGFNCRDCIIRTIGKYIVCCDIDWCYYPDLNVSSVNSIIHEYKSTGSISINELDCTLKIYDGCDNEKLIYKEDYKCGSPPYIDGDCADFYNPINLYVGLIGDCSNDVADIIGGNDTKIIPKKFNSLIKSFPDSKNIYQALSLGSDEEIVLKEGATCESFSFVFKSSSRGLASIKVVNFESGEQIFIEREVIDGTNAFTLESVNILYGSSVNLNILLPNGEKLEKMFDLPCETAFEKKSSNQFLTSRNLIKLKLFPNPASDFLTMSIGLGKENMNKSFKYKIVSAIGNEIFVKEISNNSTFEKINIDYLDNGLYFVYLCDENNTVLTSEKFVKY